MFRRNFIIILLALFLSGSTCQKAPVEPQVIGPASLRDVPAQRLNYRFEADVELPPETNETAAVVERNEAVQKDFDDNRPQEILFKTIPSPNNERVLAIYTHVRDLPSEYRLDMYSSDGKLLKRITHDGMAVHFPDIIVWSPDSINVAFVAMVRLKRPEDAAETDATSTPNPEIPETPSDSNANSESNIEEANTDSNADANTETNTETAPTPDEAQPIITFRSEQIYICNANGEELKPLTQKEGLIYFYFVWSPDSSALASLAVRQIEWVVWKNQAEKNGIIFKPLGRLRMVEKNGRERLLDDNITLVHPVWSPDSAKIAAAFDKQIRIYDAIGEVPTQAAIPLRNELLISSKAFDETIRQDMEENANSDTNTEANSTTNKLPNINANANVDSDLPAGVLPDAANLVSFNPIVDLRWTENSILYFETAYVREFIESTNNVRSYSRWHRLILSPQPVVFGNQNNQKVQ